MEFYLSLLFIVMSGQYGLRAFICEAQSAQTRMTHKKRLQIATKQKCHAQQHNCVNLG